MLNLVIALTLAVVTMMVGYFIWYAIFGAHHRHGDKVTDGKEGKQKEMNLKWGVKKDSYCYPSINDVMGYEFIHVVKIPPELQAGKKPELKKKEETIQEATMPGMKPAAIKAVSADQRNDIDLPPFYDPGREHQSNMFRREAPIREPEMVEQVESNNLDEETESNVDVTQEELDYINSDKNEAWPVVYDDESEEYTDIITETETRFIDKIIDAHPEKIQMPEINKETNHERETVMNEIDAIRDAWTALNEIDQEQLRQEVAEITGNV